MRPVTVAAAVERRRIRVTGTVQGVGFRPFVYREAVALGVSGHVGNDSRGVEIEAQGAPSALDELIRRVQRQPPPLAVIDTVSAETVPVMTGDEAFRVIESHELGVPAVAVSVDVATCDACLAELHDPANRRFRYPFINCTDCGPRYTIIRSVPYDRATTTMTVFELCDDCRQEYEDPADRRFHAEPVACPACGPRVWLIDPSGVVIAHDDAALSALVTSLVAGRVAAVKGLGGYHLVVDATNEAAVSELRRRKARDDKPFALMVPDLATARELCVLDDAGVAELTSPRRPIVLAPARPGGAVARGVARGTAELGVMLPYTPLHHLLMEGASRPLVMTSGNRSDEPIAYEDDDAVARLGPLADVLLLHDRCIHVRCDDSIVRAPRRDHALQVVRRSRGYAPEPLRLPVPVPEGRGVLAVGAALKNTVAVARGNNVVASHHIGDLDHPAARRAFAAAVEHLCALTGTTPDAVAHDLHPDYPSTAFATDLDLPTVCVQHHHAHVASCLVDHGLPGPVLGVAFDGFGLGPDGAAWGGEFLVADLHSYRRVGHLRSVPLPGGDRAAREPWRMALVWAEASLGEAAAAREGARFDERWRSVLSLVHRPGTITTTSVGRLFDGVAALLGLHPYATFEAQAAMALEAAASDHAVVEDTAYEADAVGPLDPTEPAILDPGPLVAQVVADRDADVPVPKIALRFHTDLARATADTAAVLARRSGLDTVALTGGVFQNLLLASAVAARLRADGLTVLLHHRVPPNDGGVSIGQTAVAASVMSDAWC